MLPRLAPKPPRPMLGAEPDLQSGEASHSTERYLPVRGERQLPLKQMDKVVVTFLWYKYHDRPLMQDEILGMIKSEYGEKKTGKFLDNRFSKLGEYEKIIDKEGPDRVRAEVDVVYNKYCDADQDAKDRRDVLMGLEVRLPPLELERSLLWAQQRNRNNIEIRTEQLYCLYALANWCKTGDGRLLSEDSFSGVAAEFLFRKQSAHKVSSGAILKKLRDSGHGLARQLHASLNSDQKIKSHFQHLALQYCRKHGISAEVTAEDPAENSAEDPAENSAEDPAENSAEDSAEDPVTSTTSEFSALTIPATAGPSRQSGGTPGKTTSEEEWSSFHDFDTESGSAGPSRARTSPPQQGTTVEPHRTAKRRERKSTDSSSPGTSAGPSKETTGSKDKGKAPVRKRPRDSGKGQKK